MEVNDIAKVRQAFLQKFPQKTILQITDYREKGVYVVNAVQTNMIKEKNQMLDTLYAVDMKTFDVYGFQPLDMNPKVYFNLKPNRTVFKRP